MSFLDRLLRGSPPATGEEADRLTVRRLQGLGADLSKPRHVLHFLTFAAESSAHDAGAAAERAGYSSTIEAPTDETAEWTVRAESMRVVDSTTVPAFRALFEQLAAEHAGEYDGWEAWPKP